MKASKLVASKLPGAVAALAAIGLLALDFSQPAFADANSLDPQCKLVMNNSADQCIFGKTVTPALVSQCTAQSQQDYITCMNKKNSADYEYEPGRPMPHTPPIARTPTESAVPNTAEANLNGKIAKDQKKALTDYDKAWDAYKAKDYATAAKLFGQAESELEPLAADYRQADDQTNGDAVAQLVQKSQDQQKLARCHSAMDSIKDNWPQTPADQGYDRIHGPLSALHASGDCSLEQDSAAWVEARYNEVQKYFDDPARNYR